MSCQETTASAVEAKHSSSVEENNTGTGFSSCRFAAEPLQEHWIRPYRRNDRNISGGKKNPVGHRKTLNMSDDRQTRIYTTNSPSLPPNVVRGTKTVEKFDFGNYGAYKQVGRA